MQHFHQGHIFTLIKYFIIYSLFTTTHYTVTVKNVSYILLSLPSHNQLFLYLDLTVCGIPVGIIASVMTQSVSRYI